MIKTVLNILIVIGFLGTALPVLAQSTFLPNQVELLLSPSGSPRPGTTVSVTARSFTIDLDRARLSWSVNGKGVANGIGIKNIEFTAPQAGAASSIHVAITASDGRTFSADAKVVSGAVDVLWEAQSYVPPLYRGKALASPSSRLTVAAITTGTGNTILSPETLIYTWKKGTTALGSLSGRGKDSITLSGPSIGGSMVISVTVTNSAGTTMGQGAAVIDATDPKVVLYQNDPLLGLRTEQVIPQDFILSSREISLTAIPYFFSTTARRSSLTYRWTIDGKSAESMPGDKGTIVLRQGTSAGDASIGISLEHISNLLQTAATSFTVSLSSTQ